MPELTMRLGRHVQRDARSLAPRFAAAMAPAPVTTRHRHYGPVLNQGDLGSCTGNTLCQALNTLPLRRPGSPLATEADAVRIYTRGTALDDVPGQMPEEDTGSTGLAVAKAAVEEGLITAYHHAFGLDQVLAALTLNTVMVGSVWTEAMFTPDARGYLHVEGPEAGGHEYLLTGLEVERRRVRMLNSWSSRWGRHGYAWLSFDSLDTLLRRDGDAMVLVR